MIGIDKQITLVVLAGGMGSRYKGLKQTDGMGPNGESIMEYSIYDAITAGFNKIVFVVNDQFNDNLKNHFIGKINNFKNTEVFFVNQTLDSFLPKETSLKNLARTKPWGTGHALLMAKNIVKEPFVVINADDYYGQQSFKDMFNFFSDSAAQEYGIMAYPILKTLSKNGAVSRGICQVDIDGFLENIIETTNLTLERNKIQNEIDGSFISNDALVSMNFWYFQNSIFVHLENSFSDFILQSRNLELDEFFLPLVVNNLVQKKEYKVKVLSSVDDWFGITYPEDKTMVQEKIKELISLNKYPDNLWN